MIITKKAMSRRTVLRGIGATLALPLLDGMVPALTALEKTRGNQFRAARILGVKHTTLNAKIKRYGISINGNRSGNQFSDHEIAA